MAGVRKPHGPWMMPQTFWDLYKTEDIDLATNMAYTKGAPPIGYFATPFWRPPYDSQGYPGTINGSYAMFNTTIDKPIDPQVQREAKHAYYSAVSWMDSQVGSILKHLDHLGVSNDTIVVLHGDHGYAIVTTVHCKTDPMLGTTWASITCKTEPW